MLKNILLLFVFLALAFGSYYFLSKNKTAETNNENVISPTGEPVIKNEEAMKQEITIVLSDAGFSPETLTIKTGTTVTWKNNSGQTATVDSDPHPVHTSYPPLNLGRFSNGETLTFTFDKPGTYGIHNHLDASQVGTIIVQ